MLMQTQPRKVFVEILAVFLAGEVALRDAPVGDRPGDTMNHLLDAVFALGGVRFAIKVFADHDVRGKGGPLLRNFAVGLFEENLAVLIFNVCGAVIPFDSLERVGLRRAERQLDVHRLSLGKRAGMTVSVRVPVCSQGGRHRRGQSFGLVHHAHSI